MLNVFCHEGTKAQSLEKEFHASEGIPSGKAAKKEKF